MLSQTREVEDVQGFDAPSGVVLVAPQKGARWAPRSWLELGLSVGEQLLKLDPRGVVQPPHLAARPTHQCWGGQLDSTVASK